MDNPIDCRGLACPEPVIRTRDFIAQNSPENLTVIVDNDAASGNVSRLLTSQGYSWSVSGQAPELTVEARRTGRPAGPAPEPVCEVPGASLAKDPASRKHLVFISADSIGRGDETLGRGLMKAFLSTLKEMGPSLWRLCFVNSGVKLCLEEAETLATLQELEKDDVSILVCGTCLNHFDVLDKKAVGQTTNMLDIVTSLQVADKVINI